MHTNLSGYVSPFWRGVLKASKAFSSVIKIEVGNDFSTRFWLDHWVGNDTLASTFPNLFQLAMDSSALANFEDGHFKTSPMISTTFLPYFNWRTSPLPPRMFEMEDKHDGLWSLHLNSLYRSITDYHEEHNYFRWIWTSQAPLKTKVHMWLSYPDRLLTADNLAKRCIHVTSLCMFCGDNPKTAAHLFLHCPFTLELWVPEMSHLVFFLFVIFHRITFEWLKAFYYLTQWSQ